MSHSSRPACAARNKGAAIVAAAAACTIVLFAAAASGGSVRGLQSTPEGMKTVGSAERTPSGLQGGTASELSPAFVLPPAQERTNICARCSGLGHVLVQKVQPAEPAASNIVVRAAVPQKTGRIVYEKMLCPVCHGSGVAADSPNADEARPPKGTFYAEPRTWVAANDSNAMEAAMIATDGRTVRLRSAEGKAYVVKLAALSGQDQQFVRDFMRALSAAGTARSVAATRVVEAAAKPADKPTGGFATAAEAASEAERRNDLRDAAVAREGPGGPSSRGGSWKYALDPIRELFVLYRDESDGQNQAP